MNKNAKKPLNETIKNIPKACSDETAAVLFLEAQRWGGTPACPRCGSIAVYQMKDRDGTRNKRYLWRCQENECAKQFTVRVGTVFEESRIPLRHWCYAFWAACASKQGVSALQIRRMTGISYKSALFMMHRIRFAMADEPGTPEPLTGTVEVDETYVGGKPRAFQNGKRLSPVSNKTPVVAMVQRGGEVRAMVMPKVNAKNLKAEMCANINHSARLMTDEASYYKTVGKDFAGGHETVVHSRGEYARGDATTNTVEGFFSILKRGVYGTFHSVSKKHLHRYVSEFQYKYNTRQMNDGIGPPWRFVKLRGRG